MSNVIQRTVIKNESGQSARTQSTGDMLLLPNLAGSTPLLPYFGPDWAEASPAEQQERYLKVLFGRCTAGFIEIRPIPADEKDRQWIPLNATHIPNIPSGKNIYIGVATREKGKGDTDAILQVPAVRVDVDFKRIPMEKAEKLLDAFPLKPSMRVHSGGGWHIYFLLETPVEKPDFPRLKEINKKLAEYFGADDVSDAPRLLRLPGTMNVKYDPPRRVRLLESDAEKLYRIDDFDFLPQLPPTPTPSPITGQQNWLYPVSKGQRHIRTTEVAGHFIGKNLPIEDVREILLLWNKGNQPPSPEKELLRIIDDFHKKRIAERGLPAPTESDSLDAIEAITEAMEQGGVDVNDLINLKLPENVKILKPWLKEGDIALITAQRGIGKTWLAISIGMAITHDWQIGPWEAGKHVGCLYIDGEMSSYELIQRFLDFLKGKMPKKAPFRIFSADYMRRKSLLPPNLGNAKFREGFMRYLKRHSQYRVIIFDNLVSLTPGLDENTRKEWDSINQWLLSLRSLDLSVIMIHHTGKSGDQRGTSAREDNINVSIQLKLPEGYQASDGAQFVVKFTKNRSFYGDDAAPLLMQLKTSPTGLYWAVQKSKSDLKVQIVSLLNRGTKQNQIAKDLGCSAQYVTQVKQEAIRDGVLDAKGRFTESAEDQGLDAEEAIPEEEVDGEGELTESGDDESGVE